MASQYEDAQFEHKPNGYIIIDGVEAAHTLQCAHCGVHYVSVRGSGKIRGWCLNCNQATCGQPTCNVCVPYERKMELEEQQWRQTQMQREVAIERQIKEIEKQYERLPIIGDEH
jgi:hypothetical protein